MSLQLQEHSCFTIDSTPLSISKPVIDTEGKGFTLYTLEGKLNVVDYCPFCGSYLWMELSQGFKKYLLKKGFSEKQIKKAWNIAVAILRLDEKNVIEHRLTVEVVTRDILHQDKNVAFCLLIADILERLK